MSNFVRKHKFIKDLCDFNPKNVFPQKFELFPPKSPKDDIFTTIKNSTKKNEKHPGVET